MLRRMLPVRSRPWLAVLLSITVVIAGGMLISLAGHFPAQEAASRGGSTVGIEPPLARGSHTAPVLPLFQEAAAMLHTRDYNGAVTVLERVLALAPELPEAHVNMGFALLGLERNDEALRYFDKALELRGSQVNALYGMAIAYERTGRLEEAIGAMNSFIHLVPEEDPYRRKAMAAVWEWRGQLNQRGIPAPSEVAVPAEQDGM